MAKKLTDKQAMFVREYLVDLNATQAAIRAGYKENSARQMASDMLSKPDIQDAVAKAMEERSERVEMTSDDVLRELKSLVQSNVRDVMFVDEQGRCVVRNLDSLPTHITRAIESVKQVSVERVDPEEGNMVESVRLEVKLHSKTAAIRMAMDHLGMSAAKDVNVKVIDSLMQQLPEAQEKLETAEFETLMKLLEKLGGE